MRLGTIGVVVTVTNVYAKPRITVRDFNGAREAPERSHEIFLNLRDLRHRARRDRPQRRRWPTRKP